MRTLKEITKAAIEHMESRTVEVGDKVSSNTVASYLDKVLFEKEMEQVISRRPLPLVTSEQIGNPGDFYAEDLGGIPVIAVRTEEGKVQVYLNVCRHRGAKLTLESKGQNCKKIVCPFHGWSYQLNGELSEVTDAQNCFAKPPIKGLRLIELASYECAGMIWVILDPDYSEINLKNSFAHLLGDLPELGFKPAFNLPEKSFTANFNWKIGVEAFLEVYHFAHAHAPYLSELEFPNLSLADTSDLNYRIVVPLKKPIPGQPILEWAQVMYFIFPSSFLLFYDDHVALISLVPVNEEQTRFRYIPLVPTKDDQANQKIQKKVDFLEIIIGQDIAILEGIQKGLRSKANSRFTFTRLEHLLGDFHKNLLA